MVARFLDDAVFADGGQDILDIAAAGVVIMDIVGGDQAGRQSRSASSARMASRR